MRQLALLHHLDHARVVVMGLGLHGGGVATTNWLTKRGAHVTVTDLRPARVLRASLRALRRRSKVTLVLGRHRPEDFAHADLIVQNPAVPNTSPFLVQARRQGTPIINEATIFFALCTGTTIGITGTKGKSTVSSLTAHLLRQRFGKRVVLAGNIRETAMLDVLDNLTPQSLVVLELSSWQLEGLAAVERSPDYAVVTNLLDDHLNRYPSRAAYAAAKAHIFRWQRPRQLVLLNKDNPVTRSWLRSAPGRVVAYSRHPLATRGAYLRHGAFTVRLQQREERIAPTSALPLRGAHLQEDALPAVFLARYLGVPARTIARALTTYRGLPGRLQTIRRLRGVTYVNDTTATAPVGTIASLAAFPAKVVLIAGGVDKGLSYRALARRIPHHVRALVLLPGSGTDKLRKDLQGFRGTIRRAPSMKAAVQAAQRLARAGETVLLSPAAASFNLFLHEFDRGDQFNRAVRALR